jgi:hypothetical protein
MKLMKGFLSSLFVMFLGFSGLYAQNAIPVSGGDASGSGGTASYTVGQNFYTTNTGSNGSVAQGVQQAYEITEITGSPEIKGLNLTSSVYPNPTTDFLVLNVDASSSININTLSYMLYDVSGKVIEMNAVRKSSTTIQMGKLVAGTYFVKLVQTNNAVNQEIKTFKVVKIK